MARRLVLFIALVSMLFVACNDGAPAPDDAPDDTPTVEENVPPPAEAPTEEASEVAPDQSAGAYVALGDSVAVGIGARGVAGAYPSVVHQRLSEQESVTELINLAVSGETTVSMRAGGQLVAALQQLEDRNGNDVPEDDISLVTLTIGGNDAAELYQPCAAGPTERCLRSAGQVIEAFRDNFTDIVRDLRDAAGDVATIVATTYYNPLRHPECLLSEQADLADEFLEGGPSMPDGVGFNDVIRDVAAEEGVLVADLFGHLDEPQLVPDCLHPTAEGHAVIAGRVVDALGVPEDS